MANNKKEPYSNKSTRSLFAGQVYKGRITAVSMTSGMCTVEIESPSIVVENCRWAAGAIFAPLIGFKLRQIPSPGTNVFLLYGNPSFIIQVAPGDHGDEVSGNSSTSTGEYTRPDSGVHATGVSSFSSMNADLLEGEFDITNAFNVGMLFLTNMMAVKSGERAKIETHLLNDMVRIVAERLDTHTSNRSVSEFNDGRLSTEEYGFAHPHEADLVPPNTPAVDIRGNKVDFTERRDIVDLYTARYKKYTGWLGNFIHEFIKDPTFTSEKIVSANCAKYTGADGTILYRTLAEIAFEKVVRVAIPVRIRKPTDPEGDKPEDLKEIDVAWDFTNPQETAYQLREYARYLSNFKAMSRFLGSEKDFKVPTEAEHLPPSDDNEDPDASKVHYVSRYSTIRIMRDGCILTTDGWGATYYSGYGNVQISAPFDMEFSAGGQMVFTSKDMFIRSNRNIEVTSDNGGVVVNALKHFKTLVRDGSIWMKSDANDSSGENVNGGAIFLDSAEGDVTIRGERGVSLLAPKSEIVMESTEMFINVRNFLRVRANELFGAIATLFTMEAGTVRWKVTNYFQVNDTLMVLRNKVVIGFELFANMGVKALRYIQGPLRPPRPIPGVVTDTDKVGEQHMNHIDTIDPAVKPIKIPDMTQTKAKAFKPKKDYLASTSNARFILDTEGKLPTQANRYRPHAQFMTPWNGQDNGIQEPWNLQKELPAMGRKRTDKSIGPWPYPKAIEKTPADNENLHRPSDKKEWTQTPLNDMPVIRQVNKK